MYRFRIPNISLENAKQLLAHICNQRQPEAVTEMHQWLTAKGIIEQEPEIEEDEDEAQLREFHHPSGPESQFWDPEWPKGIVTFADFTALTFVPHNKTFSTQARVLLV